jgi:nucleoside-diphosphate-sugar epimerase
MNRSVAGLRVLVTGASGKIGSETVARLTGAGAYVTALSNTRNETLAADRILIGDTRSESDVEDALDGVDLVVHLAAMPHRDAGSPYEVYSTNVVSTFNVLAKAGARGVRRAVVAGSINRYGLPLNVHPDLIPAYFPIGTDIPIDVGDWYSLSKLNDENSSKMAWRYWGIDIVTLRFPNVGTVASLTERSAKMTADPRSGLSEAWSYLDVRDAARAIELGLTANTHGAQAFFLAANRTLMPYRTEELLDTYAPGTPKLRPFVEREVPMDLTPARDLIGFEAKYELEIETLELPTMNPVLQTSQA